ncbi:hypothetical protein T484DRAFT_1756985 [Baffinella frigidus]|nr:hypothetical protein T484DRAFT_1756985 [Cryptophyta sp. CCMP2293]
MPDDFTEIRTTQTGLSNRLVELYKVAMAFLNTITHEENMVVTTLATQKFIPSSTDMTPLEHEVEWEATTMQNTDPSMFMATGSDRMRNFWSIKNHPDHAMQHGSHTVMGIIGRVKYAILQFELQMNFYTNTLDKANKITTMVRWLKQVYTEFSVKRKLAMCSQFDELVSNIANPQKNMQQATGSSKNYLNIAFNKNLDIDKFSREMTAYSETEMWRKFNTNGRSVTQWIITVSGVLDKEFKTIATTKSMLDALTITDKNSQHIVERDTTMKCMGSCSELMLMYYKELNKMTELNKIKVQHKMPYRDLQNMMEAGLLLAMIANTDKKTAIPYEDLKVTAKELVNALVRYAIETVNNEVNPDIVVHTVTKLFSESGEAQRYKFVVPAYPTKDSPGDNSSDPPLDFVMPLLPPIIQQPPKKATAGDISIQNLENDNNVPSSARRTMGDALAFSRS